jgi:hypothetical protein
MAFAMPPGLTRDLNLAGLAGFAPARVIAAFLGLTQ